MSESPHAELERIVNRTVSALRAGPRRKAMICEELSAHLLDVFAQESRRAAHQPREALEATVRRLGDRENLARELQASVPVLESVLFTLLSAEHLMWRLLVLVGVFGTLFGVGVVLPALAKLKHLGLLTGQLQTLMSVAVGLMIGVVIVTAGIHLLAWGIVRRVRMRA